MKKQKGATLVIALSLLTIITFVAVYTIESSSIQGRMISSSIISYSAFQDTNNELVANVRFYDLQENFPELLKFEVVEQIETLTAQTAPKDTNLASDLIYTGRKTICPGDEADVGSPVVCPIFEITSVGSLRSSTSNQSIGLMAKRLEITGTESTSESSWQ